MLLACFPSNLINPNVVLDWLGFYMYLAMCVSMVFLSSLWNHARVGGDSDAKSLTSTLAYGWVEHCNNVASCETTQSQDKYLLLFFLTYLCICISFNKLWWTHGMLVWLICFCYIIATIMHLCIFLTQCIFFMLMGPIRPFDSSRCWSRILHRRDDGWGHESVVLELMLQQGPQ